MHDYCHRCGGELAASEGVAPFCPHCGAPQLVLPDYSTAAEDESADETTGVEPPPRPQTIDWKTAILCTAVVALVAGVLTLVAAQFPKMVFAWWLWTFSGAAISLALYQKRKPQAWMDATVGARIGVVSGLTLIFSIAVSMAIVGLVARFGLHTMGPFDTDIRMQLERAAAMNPRPDEAMRYVKLPEFRVAIMLGGFAIMSGGVMLISALGGAMSGMMRMRRS